MLRLLLGRLWQTVIVVLIVSVIVFTLMHLVPGDPVQMMFGEEIVSEEQKAVIRAQLGLDQPILVQYFQFLVNLFRGDLGTSLFYKAPVAGLIGPALIATLELTLASMLVAIVFGTPIAILAAIKQGTGVDKASSAVALFGISMPSFSAPSQIFEAAADIGCGENG